MSTSIWYHNFGKFLFDKNSLFDIIPTKSQTLIEQLNSAMRFSIYFSLILWVFKEFDFRVWFFAIFVGVVTWMIYNSSVATDESKNKLYNKLGIVEDFYNKKQLCVKPTKDNPFMNVTLVDYADFPNRPPACSIKESNNEVAALFEEGLNRDEHDVYFKSASDRQFFTMPFTTIPNDRGTFADWLYKTGPTCKEKNLKCFN